MLTDAQIAMLCDIGQASSFDEKKKAEVLNSHCSWLRREGWRPV